jgi:hypothetical protein
VAVLGAISLGLVILYWFGQGVWPGDTYTYFLAGQRLNTGGQIYDLRPVDYFYAGGPPLYGPPLIAVIWRPIAAIPGQWGVLIWLIAMGLAALWAVVLVLLELPVIGGLATAALSLSLGLMIGVGNVDGLVLFGIIGAWRWRDRPAAVGPILGFLVTLKLTPALLIFWLMSTHRWRAVGYAALTAGLLMGITSALANDPGIALRYVDVMRYGLANGAPWDRLTVVAGTIGVVLLSRHWPAAGFSLAVVIIPVVSPVTAIHTWSLLLAGLAPLMGYWPPAGSVQARTPIGGSDRGGTIGGLRGCTEARIVRN